MVGCRSCVVGISLVKCDLIRSFMLTYKEYWLGNTKYNLWFKYGRPKINTAIGFL